MTPRAAARRRVVYNAPFVRRAGSEPVPGRCSVDYPLWIPSIGPGVLMGLVAIAHVTVSHFAIGGGLLIAVSETLAARRGDDALRELARRSSFMLILVSTVFGAITGVGIWVVAGLVAPAAISTLIHNYVWGWAIEWVFFIVEIVAALVYYATWDTIRPGLHRAIGWIYFVAAYMSLVIINGIITFMLTPGRWLETGAFWDGFFNPTYWPGLLLRTGITLIMAGAFVSFTLLRSLPEDRWRLARYLGIWLVAGCALALAGYLWWERALPEPVRSLFAGADPLLASLAATRTFLLAALAAVAVLSAAFYLAWPKGARLPAAVLLFAAAVCFFGGYERLREGTRKPFLIRDYQFSNGLRVADIAAVNESGVLARAPWAARGAAPDPVDRGRRIFMAECRACHTIDGYLGIRARLPDDRDMIYGVVYSLYEKGEAYAEGADTASLDYPFMPPFVGTEDELEALVDYLAKLAARGQPSQGASR
ncbi:MAG: cytochrome C [Acidobacteria bacterium]|nr:MAG: cytochrome C [Acidobacteriota bacterium]